MKQGSRILIAGCGYVGCATAQRLYQDGHTVFGIRRSLEKLPPGIQPIGIDLLSDDYSQLPEHLDAVVWALSPEANLAGYQQAYVEAPRRLLEFLRLRGDALQRAVLVGSTSVWSHTDGAIIDDNTVPNPANYRGQSILAGESVFRACPFESVSLRVAGIYGPQRTNLLTRIRTGIASPPSKQIFANRIWRDDIASAITHVLQLPEPNSAYTVVDNDPADLREVYAWLANRLSVQLAPAVDSFTARGGSKRCQNSGLRASGWQPTVPDYRAGYELLLAH